MKLAAVIILSVVLVLLGVQIYKFWNQSSATLKEYLDFKMKLETAKLDEEKFQEEINYYKNPANLEKELRARFNYKSPDEKLIIIVPKNQSSTSASTTGQ